jgi:GNAT superfamily N-acetyltransferase
MAEAKLVEMTTEKFERRRGWMIRQHAERLADLGGVPLPDALARAERDVMRFFPETPRTPGRLLRTAWADGEEIGCVWATVLGLVPPAAWIDWIVVDEPHRRRGYGRAILEAMEAELGGLGVSQLEGIPGTLDSPVTLVPIKSAAFQRRMESYVVAIMSDYGLPAPWAHKRAWRPLEHGLDTEGVFLRAVLADDAEVGWVCYALRHPTIPGTGWIYRLDIDPAFRSRGYGTATVVLVEADLVARGVRRIGTAVPGCNAGAQRLADRLGYALTAQQMSKSLPAVSGR